MQRYLSTFIFLLGCFAAQSQCISCGNDTSGFVEWRGTTNSDWNTASNWEGNALPGGRNIVIDPANYTNAPVIVTASVFEPTDLAVENGGELIVNADLTIGDDFIIRTGGVVALQSGVIESGDDINLCAGGNLVVTGGTFDSAPAGQSGVLRVCTTVPDGEPLPTINISGGVFLTTTLELPGGFNLDDFLTVTGGSFTSGGDTILPVELTSFDGRSVLSGILLEWQTATEINNSHFEVQRSGDGVHFESIGIVGGAGSTNTPQAYDYLDQNPLPINYYRLKQVDFDGEFELFSIVKVDFTNFRAAYQARYDEQEHRLLFSSVDDVEEVRLYDSSGRVVLKYNAIDRFDVSTAIFSPGLYLLRVVDQSIPSTQKLIIGR